MFKSLKNLFSTGAGTGSQSPKVAQLEIGDDFRDVTFIGAALLAACGPHKIDVFDFTTGVLRQSVSCQGSDLQRIRKSPSGTYVAVSGEHFAPGSRHDHDRGEAIAFSVHDEWKRIDLPRHEARVGDIIFLGSDTRIATFSFLHSGSSYINVIEVPSGQVVKTVKFGDDLIGSATVSPDGRLIAFEAGRLETHEQKILVYSTADDFKQPSTVLKQPGNCPMTLEFLDDDHLICVSRLPKPGGQSWDQAGFFYVWQISTGAHVKAEIAGNLVKDWETFGAVAVHPGRQQIAIEATSHRQFRDKNGVDVETICHVAFLDRKTWSLTAHYSVGSNYVKHLCFSPDGGLLISTQENKPCNIKVWSVPRFSAALGTGG